MDANTYSWSNFGTLLAYQEQIAAWRAEAPPDPPILSRRNPPASFCAADIPHLARWLVANGFDAEPGRCATEYCRLLDGRGAVITLYYSGTVLVQGPDISHALATLHPLLPPVSLEGDA